MKFFLESESVTDVQIKGAVLVTSWSQSQPINKAKRTNIIKKLLTNIIKKFIIIL
jgi:hypothetical protein